MAFTSISIGIPFVLIGFFTAPPRKREADPPAAETVTLKDGTVLKGLILDSSSGQRGKVIVAVRRSLIAKTAPVWSKRRFEQERATWREAVRERAGRLKAWRAERRDGPGEDRKLSRWIDDQIASLGRVENQPDSPLFVAVIDRRDVRTAERRTADQTRLVRKAWLLGIEDPETMKTSELKGTLEARGVVTDARDPASIADLLPPVSEPEDRWMIRRAATEVKYDEGNRFIRQGPMIIPDLKPGQAIPGANGQPVDLKAGLDVLKSLLGGGDGVDPLVTTLKGLADQGRAGAIVTELDMAPDLSRIEVRTTMYVRSPDGPWVPVLTKSGGGRPEDAPDQNAQDLAADPTVKQTFDLIESLGFGQIDPGLKNRALKVGVATRAALGQSRNAFNEELERIALPVGASPSSAEKPVEKPVPADKPAGKEGDAANRAVPKAQKDN